MHLLILLLALLGPPGAEQSKLQFVARLSTVPIDVALQATIAGRGSVTASLVGRTLRVTGEFVDLKSPATFARLHVSPHKGIRGPAIFDLTATKSITGRISGTLDLTEQQIEQLKVGRVYIQLHSEKAPEGNLWGWLLPQEVRR